MNNTETSINVILNQWSLTIQVAILSVFVVIFFALKLKSQRRAINSWFYAWLFNALALIMVIFVLIGSEYFSQISLRIFYSLYAVAKNVFAILLLVGLYQLLQERNLLTKTIQKIMLASGLTFITCVIAFELDLLSIQILVYVSVGVLLFIGSVIYLMLFWLKDAKIILFAFLFEGLFFLHHAFILVPVAWGDPLPDYMTHISFFDAILELIVGISCLYFISNQVINEMSNRNQILAKSQSTLRKLVNVDPLTGLWHRRYFDTFLKQHDCGASVVYLKIDQLNAINEEWGYSVGDLCIKEMCKVMKEVFSSEDGLFRIKGNSFLIITPGIEKETINKSVQKLRNSVAINPMCAPILSLTTSITTYQQQSELEGVLKNS